MREEPNVYINGRPYVLREDERPYKNLQEYSGIDYQRLQRMEVRMQWLMTTYGQRGWCRSAMAAARRRAKAWD